MFIENKAEGLMGLYVVVRKYINFCKKLLIVKKYFLSKYLDFEGM